MKTTTNKAVWSFYGLCLMFMVYACRNQDATPLAPKYTMESLRDLQLPGLRVTPPAAVTVTASTLTPSATASQVKSDIAAGNVTPAVSQAAADMAAALSAAGIPSAAVFNAEFTPTIINSIKNGGKLPSNLQAEINSLVANPTLQKYFPTFTYPQVNGNVIGPTTTTIPGPGFITLVAPVTVKPVNYVGDPCFKAANDLFDAKIAGLENDRQSQVGTVQSNYNSGKSTAESDVQGCISGKLAQYTNLVNASSGKLTTDLANLVAIQGTLGATNYDLLKAFTYLLYTQENQLYYDLQSADVNACTITAIAKVAAAKFAFDTDVNAINNNFNETVRQAQRIVLALFDSCHNQGTVAP
ncbi:hypothetical protein EXU85_08565 [Spirosoma sp. KCTC 42546]|uniref:hypothetical protein n=1 Tax=Spirosoma sp. KCTC 42546 TaxID=2520506 RepID=UPI00115A1704|nr:hypothetical protein [Spirosoma sp. KCTC 42546]QDK78661.1 hypothetical protein EXU85_08565 [Spirosoma sp. KCTC 42546]